MGSVGGGKPNPDIPGNPGYVQMGASPGATAAGNAANFAQYQAGRAPVGRAPVSGNYGMSPYQQGLNPAQQQAGLQRIQQGMGMAQQSYNRMGQMGGTFMNNAQNAGNAAYNPAIGAYQSAMNQNSQNIGSQLASQRGASVDPGLAARNIGQAGASAAQQGAGQMSGQVAQFKTQNQGMAANAYQGQGQMAGAYGQMAGAYAQAGLANQGQILNAIAAQNAANMAMQSNVNSSNVAMQSNMNNANVAMQANINDVMSQQQMASNQMGTQMYNAGLGYNANIYGSGMGFEASKYSGAGSGGLFGGGGFLGLGFAKGGVVGQHGEKPKKSKADFVKALQGVPKYARGGRIPEAKRRKMAEGGDPGLGMGADNLDDLSHMGGGEGAGGGGSPYHLMDQMNLMPGESGGMPTDPGGGGNSPLSMMGKILMGGDSGLSMNAPRGFGGGKGGGGGDGGSQLAQMGLMALMAAKGGMIPQPMRMAQGSIVPDQTNPGMVQQSGPSMPNFALAGSPDPSIAMPSTGLPMGNAQTRGGGPMPGMGQSGAMQPQQAPYGQPQQPRPPGMPGMARGGMLNGRRAWN